MAMPIPPVIPGFPKLDLLTGRVGKLKYVALKPDELGLFEDSWNRRMTELAILDPEIVASFEANKSFYRGAAGVAKGYFDVPYGGDRASSGQFGDVLIRPQDFFSELPSLKQVNVWKKTITTIGWNDLFGDSTDPIKTRTTKDEETCFAIHKLISYDPSPAIQTLRWIVNTFPYPVYPVEPYSKISKAHKVVKLIPLPTAIPGGLLIHPCGEFYLRAAIETAKDIEVAPLGLCFAKWAWLRTEKWL